MTNIDYIRSKITDSHLAEMVEDGKRIMKYDIINSEVLYFYSVERDIIVAVIDYERVKK